MNLRLVRNEPGSSGVFGTLYDDNNIFLCLTLERGYPLEPKIPVGTYTCTRYNSPHFGYEVFQLMNVPGHEKIEIHIANYQEELDGCIAIGKYIGARSNGGKMLTSSKDTFQEFMRLQKNVDSFTLTIE